ncbi:probable inactive receptor kinase At4g23740 [Macadamia integrifolia]|uniref:probable inactive receptor kinase At4g23740 n=1 Tax=Macadamia integrifolia TaxID=60698 RepID=UPI001C4FEEE3|nr:probable inactive receptor kinase At4g23740 [Macadamia integrifolia]XP_042505002.1 probable inactive receptor kinase At4g23740 [Macadamia integrifolia]
MDAVFIFSAIFLFGSLLSHATAGLLEDKRALLDFINNTPHSRSLNWNVNLSVCSSWIGVTCSPDNSRVIALRLPGVGFQGRIPPDTLSRLTALQILSLRSNALSGPFSPDFYNLTDLSFLYLQFNSFSGPLPSDFSAWKNLTIFNLSYNAFNGSIPSSISNLTHLTALNLANNSLSGEIPALNLPSLQQLDLENNSLTGKVPKSLRRFPNSAFLGNNISFPNSPLLPVGPPPSLPSPSRAKLSESALLGIIVGGCVLGFFIFAFILIACCSQRKGENRFAGKLPKGERSPEKAVTGSQDGNNRLVFFEGCNYAFDLEDLLRASAEVLGKGTFGTAYKAILEDVTTVVVKRLKEVSVGKRDFEQQMDLVGSIKHENVVELRAYYYSKEEKLMVYDYHSQGSVSVMLHGKRGEGRTPLDWETRLRIAIGAARGIARIHTENGGKLVHGNIKSSNIFLNSQNYGCVSDLGLTTLMSPVAPPISRAAGYRAPEVIDTRKATQSSDVYSFGVLLLELLTGKSPVHATGGDEIVHLVRWVHSVVREEWTAEVFDVELMRYPNIEEEMVEMLQIAMACVVRMPEQRLKIADVVKMVEDIRRVDTGNRPSSEIKSEASTPPPPQAVVGMESSSLPQ